MARCLVFVYGLLQPGFSPPRTMTRHWPDEVAGLLYDLGPYPGAVTIGEAVGWIEGSVVEIDERELARLDEFENVAAGEYVRVRTTTRSGHEAWIYRYQRSLPPHAELVRRWTGADGG